MTFGAFINNGPSDWQIIQQENGYADIELSGTWVPAPEMNGSEASVFVRIVKEDTGDVVKWWTKARNEGKYRWWINLEKVPSGGTYRLETCLMGNDIPFIELARRGDMVHHLGVGDVFVIAGQSNSAGYGRGSVYDPPEIGVHILKNSGKWDLATHPLNDSTATIHPENMENTNPGHSPYLSFGKRLKSELGYPIGLIQASRGGSTLAQWNPEEEGDLFRCMMNIINSQGGRLKEFYGIKAAPKQ